VLAARHAATYCAHGSATEAAMADCTATMARRPGPAVDVTEARSTRIGRRATPETRTRTYRNVTPKDSARSRTTMATRRIEGRAATVASAGTPSTATLTSAHASATRTAARVVAIEASSKGSVKTTVFQLSRSGVAPMLARSADSRSRSSTVTSTKPTSVLTARRVARVPTTIRSDIVRVSC
jgi:hypothetical protein